jgi:hypothetical protein
MCTYYNIPTLFHISRNVFQISEQEQINFLNTVETSTVHGRYVGKHLNTCVYPLEVEPVNE